MHLIPVKEQNRERGRESVWEGREGKARRGIGIYSLLSDTVSVVLVSQRLW